jgi:hypothetical protein
MTAGEMRAERAVSTDGCPGHDGRRQDYFEKHRLANPFYGLIGPGTIYTVATSSLTSGPTIAEDALLKHWPQYSSVSSFRKPVVRAYQSGGRGLCSAARNNVSLSRNEAGESDLLSNAVFRCFAAQLAGRHQLLRLFM